MVDSSDDDDAPLFPAAKKAPVKEPAKSVKKSAAQKQSKKQAKSPAELAAEKKERDITNKARVEEAKQRMKTYKDRLQLDINKNKEVEYIVRYMRTLKLKDASTTKPCRERLKEVAELDLTKFQHAQCAFRKFVIDHGLTGNPKYGIPDEPPR